MATKRTPINRQSRRQIRSPEMLQKVTRYLELADAHMRAIQDASPEAQLFYSDGRHAELCDLSPQVTLPLDIHPWEDACAILQAMLSERLE